MDRNKEGIIGTLLALTIVLIVMLVLTFTIFGGVWQFWMWFPVMGCSIAVLATILYYLVFRNK